MALNLMTPRYVAPDVTKAPLAGEAIRSSQASTNLAAQAQQTRDRAQQASERNQAIQAMQGNVRLDQEWQRINLSQDAQALSVAKAANDMRHKNQMLPLQMAELENRMAGQDMDRRLTASNLARQNQIINATPEFNDYMSQLNNWDASQSAERPPVPPAGLPADLRAKADGAFASLRKMWLDRVDQGKKDDLREKNNTANRNLLSGMNISGGRIDSEGNVSVSLGGTTGSRSGSGGTGSRGNFSGTGGQPYYGGGHTGKLTTGAAWDATYNSELTKATQAAKDAAELEGKPIPADTAYPEAYAEAAAWRKHAVRFTDKNAAMAHTRTAGSVGAKLLADNGRFPFWNADTKEMDVIVVTKVNERGEVVTPMDESEKQWRDAGYTAPPLSWNPPMSFHVDEEGSRVDIHDPELPKDKRYEEVGGLTDQQVTAINADIHPTLIDAIKEHQPSSTYNDDGTKLKPEDILTRFMKDNVLQVANELDVTDASALGLMNEFGDVMISEWEHSAAKGKDRWDVTKEDLRNYTENVRRLIKPRLEALGKPDPVKVADRKEAESFNASTYDLKYSRGDEAAEVAKRIGLPMGNMKAYADKYHDQHGAYGTGRWRGGEEKWSGGQGSMGYGPDTGVYETYEDKYRAEGLPWGKGWVDPYWIGTHRKQTFKGTTSERMKSYAKKNYKARQDNAAEAKAKAKAQNRKGLKPVPTRP